MITENETGLEAVSDQERDLQKRASFALETAGTRDLKDRLATSMR